MCMSELLDCFLVAKLMIARGTPFEIGLIIRLESWLRNRRDHARTGRSGQSFLGKITYGDLVGVVPQTSNGRLLADRFWVKF